MEEASCTHGGEPFADEQTETYTQHPSSERAVNLWVAELFSIFSATNQLLKDFNRKKQMSSELPIPVEEIVKFRGYEIIEEDLNRYRSKQISLTLGKISIEDRLIRIDNGIGVSYSQKRYAAAHELGHAYLEEELCVNSKLCTEARIPGGRSEFLADIFAAFLMLPPKATFQYVNEYIQSNLKRLVDHEKMMAELSAAAKYPYTRTITAYEYLRLLASFAHYHKEDTMEFLESIVAENPRIGDPQELLLESTAPKELYS